MRSVRTWREAGFEREWSSGRPMPTRGTPRQSGARPGSLHDMHSQLGRYTGPRGFFALDRPFVVARRVARASAHPTRAPALGPAARLAGRARALARVAFINRNFALLWWGQAVSNVGDVAFDMALVLWIASFLTQGQSWSPLAVSFVILARAMCEIVVGPVAGVFVDRWDKRLTMLHMNALQAIFAVLLVLVTGSIALPFVAGSYLTVSWQLGLTYATVALITVCLQFFLPAQFALIKDIVPEDRQEQAIETSQATQGLAIIVAPPIAAVLVFTVGIEWALVLNAISFVVSYLSILAIHAPAAASSREVGEASRFWGEFLAGLRYVSTHRILHTILVSVVLTWLGFGALEGLGYFFITENLHTPASYYGFLGTDFGIGAIVGAVLVTVFGQRIGLARILWVALICSGVFVAVMSHLTNFYAALGAAFLFGVSATSIIVTASPLALHATSREFVGRVTAVIKPLGRLAALISIGVAGYVVSTTLRGFHASIFGLISFNRVNAVFTGMGLLAVLGGIYARINLHDMIARADRERSAGRRASAATVDEDGGPHAGADGRSDAGQPAGRDDSPTPMPGEAESESPCYEASHR